MPASSSSRTRHAAILLLLSLVVLIAQIDTSVVNLAVHSIGHALRAPIAALQWVLDGYNLSYATLLLTGGTVADLFGRVRILRLGTAAFVAGSLLAGLAPHVAVLIAGRVIAGIGAALMLPSSLALIRVIWPDPYERAHTLGIWAGVNGAALALGPTLGGGLIQVAGWRSVFLLIVPIAAMLWWWAPRVIPESSDPQSRSVDLPGQVLGAFALAALATATIMHRLLLPSLIAAGVAIAIFLWVESRAGSRAMMPLPLLRNGRFMVINATTMTMTFAMYGILFLLPLTWQRSGAMSVGAAGLALLPMSLSYLALSHRSGAWVKRYGAQRLIVYGMLAIVAGIALLASTSTGLPLWRAEVGLLFTGVGMALNTAPLLGAAVAAVHVERAGTASAMINTARMIGATLGVAVLGSAFSTASSLSMGFRVAMVVGLGVVLLGALLAQWGLHET